MSFRVDSGMLECRLSARETVDELTPHAMAISRCVGIFIERAGYRIVLHNTTS
jgi:hypothetical protein